MYTGRFAPSPTGPLHFGSLVAALASWLDARASGGKWLVRIEDLDRARSRPAMADAILRQLDAFGLGWDGPVTYQSARLDLYNSALKALERDGHVYWCCCSRKEIADSATRFGSADDARSALAYPGTCRNGMRPGGRPRALRLRVGPGTVRFVDRLQGAVEQRIEREVGDFVVLRAEGMFAYQLAVVVDDGAEGVTEVVRGDDLLSSTARQYLLQEALGLPHPVWAHVPLVTNAQGQRLAKREASLGLAELRDRGVDPRRVVAWAARSVGLAAGELAIPSDLLTAFDLATIAKDRVIAPKF